MKKVFNARTVGFYFGFVAGLIALIGAIGLIATDFGDITFSWITVALAMGGFAFEILNCLADLAVAPLLSAVCFGCALSWHLYIGLPTLSDIWNGVNYIGGNAKAVIVFGVIFAVATLLGIVSCFMSQRKKYQIISTET